MSWWMLYLGERIRYNGSSRNSSKWKKLPQPGLPGHREISSKSTLVWRSLTDWILWWFSPFHNSSKKLHPNGDRDGLTRHLLLMLVNVVREVENQSSVCCKTLHRLDVVFVCVELCYKWMSWGIRHSSRFWFFEWQFDPLFTVIAFMLLRC